MTMLVYLKENDILIHFFDTFLIHCFNHY